MRLSECEEENIRLKSAAEIASTMLDKANAELLNQKNLRNTADTLIAQLKAERDEYKTQASHYRMLYESLQLRWDNGPGGQEE